MAGGDDFYEAMEEAEFNDFLKALIDTGDLRGKPAEGIAKLVLDKGQKNLSEKQLFVFNRDVVEVYRGVCEECGEQVPWSEAYEFYHSGDRCGSCQTRYENFMAE